jgi:hypothetical protein
MGLKSFEREEVKTLMDRQTVVLLKETREEVMEELEDEDNAEALIRDYKNNIKRLNKLMELGFKKYWSFTDSVLFVKRSNLEKYKSDTNYAILTLFPYKDTYVEKQQSGALHTEKIHYWVWVFDKAEQFDYEASDFSEGDMAQASYHMSFPQPVRKSEEESDTSLIPIKFRSFEYDKGWVFSDKIKIGYPRSVIWLSLRSMQNHLDTLYNTDFSGSIEDYINRQHANNCHRLQGSTLMVSPGAESYFFNTNYQFEPYDNSTLRQKYEKNSPDFEKRCSCKVKVASAFEIDSSIATENEENYYVFWYPYDFDVTRLRVVFNHKGEIIARGRYISFRAWMRGDMKEFADCKKLE